MTGAINSALAWLWHNSWQAAVVVGVVLVIQAVCLHGGARRFRAALWAVVLVRLVMPAGPASSVSLFNAPEWVSAKWMARRPSVNVAVPVEQAIVVRTGYLPGDALPVEMPYVPAPVSTGNWMAAVWAVGCGGLLIALVASHHRFRRRLAGAVAATDPELLALVRRCAVEMRLWNVPGVYFTDAVASPALAGLIHPRLLFPAGRIDLTADQLRLVILHELAHLKRRDLWVDFACDLLLALHWFNPLIWLARARYRADRELARDEMVLRVAGPTAARGYGALIVQLLERTAKVRTPSVAVGILEGPRSMRRRIRHIAGFGPRGVASATIGGACLLVLGCASLTERRNCDPKDPAPRAATQPAAASEEASLMNRVLGDVEFQNTPFRDAIERLSKLAGTRIFVNWHGLEKVGIRPDYPVTMRLRGIRFGKALRSVLSDVSEHASERAAWFYEDGLITVSTAGDAALRSLATRVYDIRDFLVDAEDAVPPRMGAAATEPAAAGPKGEAPLTREQLVDRIIQLVTESIDRDSWKTYGHLKEMSGQLIVTQTAANHATIATFLDQFRETRGIQLMLDMRLVVLRPDALRRLDAHLHPTPEPSKARGTVFDAAQGKAFLDALAADPGVKTLTSPRLLLVNGQRGYVMVGGEVPYVANVTVTKDADGRDAYQAVTDYVRTGVMIDTQATASSDRRYVTCTIRPEIIRLDGLEPHRADLGAGVEPLRGQARPMVQRPAVTRRSMHATVSIPDGGALLINGFNDVSTGDAAAGQAGERADNPPLTKSLLDGAVPGDVYMIVMPRIVYASDRAKGKR